jgi:hypothetical protein
VPVLVVAVESMPALEPVLAFFLREEEALRSA